MKRGQITIFLALLLSITCSLLLTIIESTQVSAMRMQIESGMDLSMHSVLAEYNRTLLSRYDLFFIDMSYRETAADICNTENHLQDYLEANLTVDHMQRNQTGDWLRFKIKDVRIQDSLLASDHDGRVFGRQAVHYMKYYANNQQFTDGKAIDQKIRHFDETNLSGSRSQAENRVSGISMPEQVSGINALRGEDTLSLVSDGVEISQKGISLGTLASHRNLCTGIGNAPFSEKETGNEYERLFDAYIFQKYSYQTRRYSQNALEYEIEYIIAGKETDYENLNQVAKNLLRVREASDVAYLLGDEEKISEAEELALLLTAGIEIPGLTEALTYSLLYAWGYAEAMLDVNRLINDGRVPVTKSSEDWRLPLKDLLIFRTYMGEGGGKGLSYQEYLSAYLAKESMSDKRKRCMDLIEANVRLTEENPYFCMDGCAEYINARADISSEYGYEYNITRSYGYEIEERK